MIPLMVFRLRAVLTGVAGSPYYLTQYFGGIDAEDAQVAWGNFLNAMASSWHTSVAWRMESDIVSIDPVTGDIIGVDAGVGRTGQGLISGELMPTMVQGLARLQTDTVAGGRRLQGRQFIPGLGEEASSNGATLSATRKSDLQQPYTALLSAANSGAWDVVVWSRKNGVTGNVVAATVQDNLATLRTRSIRG